VFHGVGFRGKLIITNGQQLSTFKTIKSVHQACN